MLYILIASRVEVDVIHRDGDVVVIRASADGQTLDIKDNHEPDASVGSSTPVSSLTEGEHSSTSHDA